MGIWLGLLIEFTSLYSNGKSPVPTPINGDDANGMRANVINDYSGSDAPWRLIITLEDLGDENKATFPDFYLLDGWDDLYIEQEREAQDAKVKLDGFEIELPDNKTSELIPGLTIDLKKAAPGEEFPIIITEDTEAVTAKIRDIIDKINSVFKFIIDQNSLDANSERKVQDAIETLRGKRTVIIVAHRLATLANADYIYVLENGRLTEEGTHEKLKSRNGLYSSLCEKQRLE